jgi:hypothetical protein
MLPADIAASLRRLVAHPTVEQHAQRGDVMLDQPLGFRTAAAP